MELMRRELERFFVGVAVSVCVAGFWMSAMRPLSAAPVPRSPSLQDGPSAGSVLDGVFTADQATRGQQTFQKVCAACHTVAEHSGKKFQERWADTSVGDLFDVISSTMPDGNPGSLEPTEYAGVIAFLLKETGYPEGKQELPADAAALKQLRIVPRTP
jgi:mono/diheme cytochrome c family protein